MRELSKTSLREIHDLSSGSLPVHRELVAPAPWPDVQDAGHGEGWVVVNDLWMGERQKAESPEKTGFRSDTWKVGWIFIEAGNFNFTKEGLMTLRMARPFTIALPAYVTPPGAGDPERRAKPAAPADTQGLVSVGSQPVVFFLLTECRRDALASFHTSLTHQRCSLTEGTATACS